MWSNAVIADFARQAAIKAMAYERVPYRPADQAEVLAWKNSGNFIPNLGDYRPEGWRLVEDVTVEGLPREWAAEIVAKDPTAGFAVIEEGQFQVVVGYFTQDPNIEGQADPNKLTSEDLEWGICPNCEEPIECKAGKFAEDTCPRCDHIIQGEVDKNRVCPACGAEEPWIDPDDDKNRICQGCENRFTVFLTGTPVIIGEPEPWDEWLHGFTGRVYQDANPYRNTVLVIDQEENVWTVYKDQVQLGYDPKTDPNQLPLPLGGSNA